MENKSGSGSTILWVSYLWECTSKFPPFPLPHVWKKYFWHWKTLLFWSKGSMELLTNLIVVTIFLLKKKSFYPLGASNQSVLFSLLRTTFFLEFKLCQGLSIFRRMRFEPKNNCKETYPSETNVDYFFWITGNLLLKQKINWNFWGNFFQKITWPDSYRLLYNIFYDA